MNKDTYEICHQFYIVGPQDLTNHDVLLSALKDLSQNYTQQKFKQFITSNMVKIGYSNARLLYNVHLPYFWGIVSRFMLKNMINDSHILSSKINALSSSINGMVQLKKYQIFLILCHMFCGTFPLQLGIRDESFGELMTSKNNEFQEATQRQLLLRLNKLKSIINYFCVVCHRHEKGYSIIQRDDVIVFQRQKCSLREEKIIQSNAQLSAVEVKDGKYYENQKNQVTLNKCVQAFIGDETLTYCLTLEQKIFFAYPQMFTLKILQSDNLEPNEAIVISGAEQYSELSAVSAKNKYDFSQKFRDSSKVNQLKNIKQTTFIFYDKQYYQGPDIKLYFKQSIIKKEILKICAGLQAVNLYQKKKDRVVSGKIKKQGFNQDLQFLIEWISASLSGWTKYVYYTDDNVDKVNLRILSQNLKVFTVRDLLAIVMAYTEFCESEKIKISLMEYIKILVV